MEQQQCWLWGIDTMQHFDQDWFLSYDSTNKHTLLLSSLSILRNYQTKQRHALLPPEKYFKSIKIIQQIQVIRAGLICNHSFNQPPNKNQQKKMNTVIPL